MALFEPEICDRPCPFQQPMDGANIARIHTSNSWGSYEVVLTSDLILKWQFIMSWGFFLDVLSPHASLALFCTTLID